MGEGASPVMAAAPLLLSPATALAKEGFEKPAPGTDLETLADAADGAAKRRAAQWFFFVAVVIALAAIVGSTTHRTRHCQLGRLPGVHDDAAVLRGCSCCHLGTRLLPPDPEGLGASAAILSGGHQMPTWTEVAVDRAVR